MSMSVVKSERTDSAVQYFTSDKKLYDAFGRIEESGDRNINTYDGILSSSKTYWYKIGKLVYQIYMIWFNNPTTPTALAIPLHYVSIDERAYGIISYISNATRFTNLHTSVSSNNPKYVYFEYTNMNGASSNVDQIQKTDFITGNAIQFSIIYTTNGQIFY